MDSDDDSSPNGAQAKQRKKKVGAQFVMLPLAILRDPTLRPVEKIVLADYLSYTGKSNQTCFPAQARVASDLGVNRGTVNGAMKQLVQRGAIRRLRRGRGFRYDLGPVYEMLKNPAAALHVAEKPSQGFAPERDDVVDSTTLLPENATGSDGESDTNYISVSDQTNHIEATPKDRFCRTDSDRANERTRGIDAGSDFENEAREAAVRLGLRTYCPHDEEWARDDIHEAILLVNGEPLNRGALDRLIERHGIIACWSQAKYLAERIDRFPTRVEKPTALYVRAVETGAGCQGGQSREERDRRIEQIVADLRTDKMRFRDIPPELDEEVMQRYAAVVLSEPLGFDSDQQPEECDDTEIPF